ncbi:MAG TPA: RagB/SusD family nutrient uptake outer membrane protein [Bacteroidales bacterium]|nr:RagB/SusD family nutrient uptake outer membrane protein [Bacteroidales bacterium]HQJ20540.1 RagB/SusD family nutrient uptake outer membrane protein [Bacteroidales bacterium]HRC89736.1 RagB/SusD family nutrient uptake outer membrane protein [Bacteroidales bacterium]
MKKILITLIIVGMSVSYLFQGCTKVLEEEAIREPVADVFYNTAEGYGQLINSCYTYTRTVVNFGTWAIFEYGTDLWTNGSDGAQSEFNTYLPSLSSRHATLYNFWSGMYIGIGICNTAISRGNKDISGMTEAQVKAKLGEALFLRAWFYEKLVMQFGDIPLVTEEVTSVVTTATRTPVQQVYNQIISDLETAESYLPVSQSDYGRANKACAQALLARIHLYLKNYDKAETYAKKVINDYDYALETTCELLWDRDNEENKEVIFPIQYSRNERLNDPSDGGMNLGHTPRYDLHPGMTRSLIYSRPYPRYMPNRHFIDMLNEIRVHDSRYEAQFLDTWLANNPKTLPAGMQIGDTAVRVLPYAVSGTYRASKIYKIYDVNDIFMGENSYGSLQMFISMNKFYDKYRNSIAASNTTRDYTEIRLAEMYLIAAEALIMQPGKKAQALPFINAIRLRAAKPGHENAMRITDENELTIDFILKERALELCAERHRWIDLKRTGKLIEYAKLYNPNARNQIQEFHLVRPIPTNFIDRLSNKAEFQQNPGY